MLWIAGMILQALLQRSDDLKTLQHLRNWDRMATTPAMLIAWSAGIFLALQGGWFGNRWLMLKLALVVALSALHGMFASQLRRRLQSPTKTPSSAALPAILVITAGIVLLVIVKPF
ncbi:MAG: CopD family protein [Steroidobacter sp.]|nr:CopD family protein [Steroidobacter sp.]